MLNNNDLSSLSLLLQSTHDEVSDHGLQKNHLTAPSSRKPATMQQVPVKNRHLKKIRITVGGGLVDSLDGFERARANVA